MMAPDKLVSVVDFGPAVIYDDVDCIAVVSVDIKTSQCELDLFLLYNYYCLIHQSNQTGLDADQL